MTVLLHTTPAPPGAPPLRVQLGRDARLAPVVGSFALEVAVRPRELGLSFTFLHREAAARAAAEGFDLFMYAEDDIAVGANHLDAFVAAQADPTLPPGWVPGFLRFERAGGGQQAPGGEGARCGAAAHGGGDALREVGAEAPAPHPACWAGLPLTDVNPLQTTHARVVSLPGGRRYFVPANVHQGFWLATRAQLQRALRSGCLAPSYRPHWFYQEREAAASDFYFRCNLTKVVPLDGGGGEGGAAGLREFLVHHMGDYYAVDKPQLAHRAAKMDVLQLSTMIDDSCRPARHDHTDDQDDAHAAG